MKDKYVSPSATETHNEVVSAVKGASTQSKDSLPDINALASLSDREFEERKKALVRGSRV